MQLRWGECTWEDIKAAAAEDYIVVFPAGAIEQHGPMLPVDTDANIAEKNANDGADLARHEYGVKCLVLPALPYGQSCHHMNFPGTISLRFETYIAAVTDVLQEVVRHGFKKIVIVNGNGGNEAPLIVAMYRVMEEEALQGREVRIYLHPGHADGHVRSETQRLRDEGVIPVEGQMGIHAGMWETSETLADRPELVKRDKLARPELARSSVPAWAWRTDELSQTGAFGDPSLATAEAGAAMWRMWRESVAMFLARVQED